MYVYTSRTDSSLRMYELREQFDLGLEKAPQVRPNISFCSLRVQLWETGVSRCATRHVVGQYSFSLN